MSEYLLDLTKEFAGRRALVTGGSRGIGAATAQRLVDGGATVVVTARNTHAETPKGATFIAGDTRTLEGAQKVAKDAIAALGGLDILVNSAGAARLHLPASTAIPDDEWVDSLNINFLSALRVTYALLDELIKTKGSIVNVTAGGRARSAKADVSDAAAVKRMFEAAETAFGGVDVLVNNAGVMGLAPIGGMDDATFDRLISINLKGTFNTLREAANRLREGGRVINFSSSVVGLYQPTYGVYAATKAGVEAMTHVFSKELRGQNITVNTIAPGPTATDLFLTGKSQEVVDHLAKLAPLERLGLPEDIANAVAFLAGPDGAWINGQVLRVNGGII